MPGCDHSPKSHLIEGARRRDVLLQSASALSLGIAGVVFGGTRASAAPPVQDDWARCVNCNMLFFNGDRRNKGHCAAANGGAHEGERGDWKKYQVTYDDLTGPGQGNWRFCRKCSVLFFDGSPEKGACAGGAGGHEAAGYNFFLYHDRAAHQNEEGNWHYCLKCHGLFNAAGVCPADRKAHQTSPSAFKFVVGKKAATL